MRKDSLGKNILIFTLIITVLFMVWAIKSTISWLKSELGVDYPTKEEVCQILEDNIDIFESVAKEVSLIENRYITIRKAKDAFNSDDYKRIRLESGVVANIYSNESMSKEQLKILNNSNVSKIIQDLDFINIWKKDDTNIYFEIQSNFKFSSGLVYVANSKPFVSDDFRDFITVEQIKENWYYYEED